MSSPLTMHCGTLALSPALSQSKSQQNMCGLYLPPLPLGEGWGEGTRRTNLWSAFQP